MKNNILLLFILLFIQLNLSAQKIDQNTELTKLKRYMKEDKLESFTAELGKVITGTNQDNVNQTLILADHIYNIAEGSFFDACDTLIDVFRRNYLTQLIQYLANRKESPFETAYINFMVGKIKYSIQQKVALTNFEASINKILPALNPKEKDYALNIKSQILSRIN